MKEAGRLSEPSLLMLSGKRSMRNGPRGHQRSFPSGLVRGQARKLVMLRLLRVRKRAVKKHQPTRKIMMKRKSKSYVLDKSTFDLPKHLWIFNLLKKDFILSAPVFQFSKLYGTGKKIINTFLTRLHFEASPTDTQDYLVRPNFCGNL